MAKGTTKTTKVVRGRVRGSKRTGAPKTKKIARTRSIERTIEEGREYERVCKTKDLKVILNDRRERARIKAAERAATVVRAPRRRRGVSTLPVRPAVPSVPAVPAMRVGGPPVPSPALVAPAIRAYSDTKTVLKAKDNKPRPLPAFGIIQVCFCIDATGSMTSYLAQTKSAVVSLISKIEEKVHSEGIELRFAVVSYRDHPPQDSSYVTQIHDFASDRVIRDHINKLDAFGGGDEPEAAHDGLMSSATQVSWTNTSAVPMVRYVFHITDAPPHGNEFVPTESQKGCLCGMSTDSVIHALNMKEIHYRLIKVNMNNERLNAMGNYFKKHLTNYEQTSIQNATDLDVRISDMVIRELVPDM